MKRCDVAVVGAGPYGLSATAHLRARGLDAFAFGEPMSFWYRHMPVGMILRSPREASDLSDPDRKLTLETYRDMNTRNPSADIPREQFVDYGLWFQHKTAPDVDTRNVVRVEKNGSFRLTLEDGDEIVASHVVVAAGLSSFVHRPQQFIGLPDMFVSHSSNHRDFAPFKNRKVAIVGAGQSAIESAALLHEAGADVEVLVRSNKVKWLREKESRAAMIALERLLYGPARVGPAGISQLIERPNCFRSMPRRLQDIFGAHRPAAASWLRQRVAQVPIHTGQTVVSATRLGNQLALTLDDQGHRVVDHVLLATGYLVDISRYEFLTPQLLAAVDKINGYPRLNSGFECSVQGLHFLGASAAWSFGPLMRFVAGTEFAARAVTKRIVAGRSCNKPQSSKVCARAY